MAKKNSRSSASSKRLNQRRRFVVCVKNRGYEASLELRKLYPALSDRKAERHRLLRVVDESGEDFLYPASYFIAIALPAHIARAVRRAS